MVFIKHCDSHIKFLTALFDRFILPGKSGIIRFSIAFLDLQEITK